MKVNSHVLIRNNSNPHPFVLCNGKTGIITYINKRTNTANVKLDMLDNVCIDILLDNLVEIPDNIFTEWSFSNDKPNFIIVGRHNKPYLYLIYHLDIFTPVDYITELIKKFAERSVTITQYSNISTVRVFKTYNPIHTVAYTLKDHKILMINDTQYSLDTILNLYR